MKNYITPNLTAISLAAILFSATGSIAQENKNAVPRTNAVKFVTEDNNMKGGDAAVTLTTNFVEMGKPTGGYPTITDMAIFNNRIYLSTSLDPLGNWGTNVFYTTDGVSYTKVLEDNSSQGYLRMGVYDNQLWIPDGDPNGLDPSYVYISSTGNPGSFTQTQIPQAVHSFDVIKYNNKLLVANGMSNYQGALCKYDGASTWNSVYQSASSFRMKYMAEFQGKLFVANNNPNSDTDYFLWNGDVQTTTPTLKNTLTGPAMTFRWFASSGGKIFWTVAANNQIRCLMSSDGNTWTPVAGLDQKFVSDYCEMNGKMYALSQNGLWESSDFTNFTQIATPPASYPNAFMPVPVQNGYNADAQASMETFNGSLWCGSSLNGKVYKVDILGTSTPENFAGSTHYQTTNHSVIFQLENNAPVELKVYSVHGSLVKNISCGTVSPGKYEIELGELKEGFYLLQAMIGNEVKGIKFVRRRQG